MKDYSILIVEENIDDALSIKKALYNIGIMNSVTSISNSEKVFEFLRDNMGSNPFIIIIDMDMTKINGLELLKSIKCDLKLKRIPVILFTTSLEEIDILKGFRLGIAGYFIKPAVPTKFNDLMCIINDYWSTNEFPFDFEI